jgi:hypothetical protein
VKAGTCWHEKGGYFRNLCSEHGIWWIVSQGVKLRKPVGIMDENMGLIHVDLEIGSSVRFDIVTY